MTSMLEQVSWLRGCFECLARGSRGPNAGFMLQASGFGRGLRARGFLRRQLADRKLARVSQRRAPQPDKSVAGSSGERI